MQKIILWCILFVSTVWATFAVGSGDRIELAITPIRIDITAEPNQATTWTVTLYNNSDQPYSFVMSAEDCTVSPNYGAPVCKPTPSSSVTANSLASWISFATSGTFTIAPRSNRTITYTIRPPANAIPGGHYGAVFFNDPGTSGTASISMNRRIGSLILVTVPGDIIVDPEFGTILVDTAGPGGGGGWGGGWAWSMGTSFFTFNQTDGMLGQLTQKWKLMLMMFSDPEKYQPVLDGLNPLWSAPVIDTKKPFRSSLGVPVENKGTIHIVPKGKITLFNKKWEQLKNINISVVKDENGTILMEDIKDSNWQTIGQRQKTEILDYININAESGNVLPGTNRTFMMDWYGFARESVAPDGSIAVSYESPGVYYSRVAQEESTYPWEKLALTNTTEELTAHVDLSYIDPVTKENIEHSVEVPVTINYDSIVKTLNTWLLAVAAIIILPTAWWIGIRRRRDDSSIDLISMDDEIRALERARAVMFAKEASKAVKTSIKKPATKKPLPKTTPKKEEETISPQAKKVAPKKVTTKKIDTTISSEKPIPKKRVTKPKVTPTDI